MRQALKGVERFEGDGLVDRVVDEQLLLVARAAGVDPSRVTIAIAPDAPNAALRAAIAFLRRPGRRRA